MKKFLILFATLFCTVAIADTITINWDVDNQTYTTTTCEIGNDVLLPTSPTKRGYIFKGWVAEHFNRGTWTDWDTVPIDCNGYPLDAHNNKVPKENDYMIVSDSSSYAPADRQIIVQTFTPRPYGITVTYNNQTTVSQDSGGKTLYADDKIYIIRLATIQYVYANINGLTYDNTVYSKDELIAQQDYYQQPHSTIVIRHNFEQLQGTWKFVYHGNWETDGKNGWKPVEQIVNE